ncbi:uncharacterized protein [Hetaerina americana]|uniref:uncharacterized protein n=1 Tax=Hetaerina americana TaxID=62018 RepID=UPI003A7F3FD5
MAPGGHGTVAPPFFPLLAALLLLLGVDCTSLETNDVFLLPPAPPGASSTSAPEAPPPLRFTGSPPTPGDVSGRRLLVLRPAADIRCYCNLPRCVTTGYMCKSASGVCFSDIADRTDVELATHGCIELLPSSRQGVCHVTAKKSTPSATHPLSPNCSPNCGGKSGGSGAAAEKGDGGSKEAAAPAGGPTTPMLNHKGQVVVMLLCCHSDMCNHIDSPEIRLRLTNDSLFVGSSSLGVQQSGGSAVDSGDPAGSPALYFGSGHDGWFRVATIAVPICGALILMLLIFVAFKILRRDLEDQKLRGSQRHKHQWRSPSQAWDEEDFCLQHHHKCTNTQSHLLHRDPLDDSPHRGHAKVAPNLHPAPMPVGGRVHLLSPRGDAESGTKKNPKLDYFFLFPRAGKCKKPEVVVVGGSGGAQKEAPVVEGAVEAEGPTAVVVVSL